MSDLFEIKPVDRAFYAARIRGFVPARIIDIHTHVWLAEHLPSRAGPVRTVTWPSLVARDNSGDDLAETYRLLLPDQQVTPLIFTTASNGGDLDARNQYVRDVGRQRGWPALLLSRPEWSAEEFEDRIARDGFLGVKVYLTFSPPSIPADQISIFDFLPPHQLEVLDRRGWMCMLHIPRPGRLRDPGNLEQLRRIDHDFPRARVVVAHVGRAYCPEDVGDAFDVLADAKRLVYDFSANTNEYVFTRLIKAVGPRRIVFGSDLPILRMRMRRICQAGRYVNLVPRGLYGDVSADPNMGELDGPEADRLTFFFYEEIDAFRRAAEAADLTRGDIEAIFCNNAARLLNGASGRAK